MRDNVRFFFFIILTVSFILMYWFRYEYKSDPQNSGFVTRIDRLTGKADYVKISMPESLYNQMLKERMSKLKKASKEGKYTRHFKGTLMTEPAYPY